jgi:drug/metabolite transporter (DMT)-like permease
MTSAVQIIVFIGGIFMALLVVAGAGYLVWNALLKKGGNAIVAVFGVILALGFFGFAYLLFTSDFLEKLNEFIKEPTMAQQMKDGGYT